MQPTHELVTHGALEYQLKQSVFACLQEAVQTDEYMQKATRDVGDLQVLSHANAEFKEKVDGSIEMIKYDNQIRLAQKYFRGLME